LGANAVVSGLQAVVRHPSYNGIRCGFVGRQRHVVYVTDSQQCGHVGFVRLGGERVAEEMSLEKRQSGSDEFQHVVFQGIMSNQSDHQSLSLSCYDDAFADRDHGEGCVRSNALDDFSRVAQAGPCDEDLLHAVTNGFYSFMLSEANRSGTQ